MSYAMSRIALLLFVALTRSAGFQPAPLRRGEMYGQRRRSFRRCDYASALLPLEWRRGAKTPNGSRAVEEIPREIVACRIPNAISSWRCTSDLRIFRPLTNVPFVLPRSSTKIVLPLMVMTA